LLSDKQTLPVLNS